jgi:cell division FtsZ-interacting protein ZapD
MSSMFLTAEELRHALEAAGVIVAGVREQAETLGLPTTSEFYVQNREDEAIPHVRLTLDINIYPADVKVKPNITSRITETMADGSTHHVNVQTEAKVGGIRIKGMGE